MYNITFVIFTFNEEARIENVIKNFIDFGKILIADNKSTDRTIEIAKNYGCDIFIREKHYDFVENQELTDSLYSVITTDWLYYGFADEMLEKSTLLEIGKIIDEDKFDIINIDRKNYFYGDFCYDLFNSRTNKIFKKHKIDFTHNKIHGFGTPSVSNDKIFVLNDKYFVHHFISNNAASYLNVINRYTDNEIGTLSKYHNSVFYSILFFFKNIFINYFFRKGYKSGFSGIVLIELTIFYSIIKKIKIYEKLEGISPSNIEEKNNKIRKLIINNLK